MQHQQTRSGHGAAIEKVRTSLGLSQREMAEVSGIAIDTIRKWTNAGNPPSPRKIGQFLTAMEPEIRRRAPGLDYLLDPLRTAIGRKPATAMDMASVTAFDEVPGESVSAARYGVRRPDGSVAICERRDTVPGHLHAVRWRTVDGPSGGIRRVTPAGKTTAALTQDDQPGVVETVRTSMLERCDPVVAIVIPLLGGST